MNDIPRELSVSLPLLISMSITELKILSSDPLLWILELDAATPGPPEEATTIISTTQAVNLETNHEVAFSPP